MGTQYAGSLLALLGEGKVICTDRSRTNAGMASKFFEKLGVPDKIEFNLGEALDILNEYHGPFDMIFNDIDKTEYPQAFRKSLPKIRRGGLSVSDNVLWRGQVLDNNPDPSTQSIQEFNKLIHSSEELFSVIVPLRD